MDGRSRREWDLRRPSSYRIHVEGHLDERPTAWPIGTEVDRRLDGDTVLTVPDVDQAALLGLLRTLRDLGVRLVSVNAAGSDHAAAEAVKEGQQ